MRRQPELDSDLPLRLHGKAAIVEIGFIHIYRCVIHSHLPLRLHEKAAWEATKSEKSILTPGFSLCLWFHKA
jgi:hypothetical protein